MASSSITRCWIPPGRSTKISSIAISRRVILGSQINVLLDVEVKTASVTEASPERDSPMLFFNPSWPRPPRSGFRGCVVHSVNYKVTRPGDAPVETWLPAQSQTTLHSLKPQATTMTKAKCLHGIHLRASHSNSWFVSLIFQRFDLLIRRLHEVVAIVISSWTNPFRLRDSASSGDANALFPPPREFPDLRESNEGFCQNFLQRLFQK
ncbi:hypothetical protein VNO77_34259 [Canavalia gladiata]|uniref:Uncharacterized protein n=1 Tax=Canavalia gladiata TaxID=3824 RepID=A0AAN9PZ38_CANGL